MIILKIVTLFSPLRIFLPISLGVVRARRGYAIWTIVDAASRPQLVGPADPVRGDRLSRRARLGTDLRAALRRPAVTPAAAVGSIAVRRSSVWLLAAGVRAALLGQPAAHARRARIPGARAERGARRGLPLSRRRAGARHGAAVRSRPGYPLFLAAIGVSAPGRRHARAASRSRRRSSARAASGSLPRSPAGRRSRAPAWRPRRSPPSIRRSSGCRRTC